ncbi:MULTISPECIES: FHA domain-containing protein [Rubinisphaera]|uniref:Forkhead-associated protein n=1 Tax=Rubinisphaera brasiliensis (strain ATCC 49424 / DSM 5305 / JCM 21570 / IAM 15109 / NBRC 103401 / IFAM 1448) TaxID=756272 RepID=F0SNA0_RUBBR|nr:MULTISPECIES: FHA domain-containing protein [Rubinisphaera]ADY62143.1 Forkhead-associated protein [Rubinisphaera brasiliensis DSM 5305]
MQAKLIPLDDGPTIEITRDVTIVGRKKGICDLVIDHPSISKLHCIVARTDGLLFIRDLGSTNGTKVNGQRVLRGAILPGDELAFAKVRFKVFLGPDVPAEVGSEERTEVAAPSAHITESHEFRFLDEDDDAEEVIQLIDDDDD